jgi:predicted RNase H-like nuclease (RuvC/YqgF family)
MNESNKMSAEEKTEFDRKQFKKLTLPVLYKLGEGVSAVKFITPSGTDYTEYVADQLYNSIESFLISLQKQIEERDEVIKHYEKTILNQSETHSSLWKDFDSLKEVISQKNKEIEDLKFHKSVYMANNFVHDYIVNCEKSQKKIEELDNEMASLKSQLSQKDEMLERMADWLSRYKVIMPESQEEQVDKLLTQYKNSKK